MVDAPLVLLIRAGAHFSLIGAAFRCVVVGGAMLTVYVPMLRAMHVPELEILAGPVRATLQRLRRR